MHAASEAEYSSRPEDVIQHLRNGEPQLRNFLVEYYWNYVLSLVSKMIGKPARSTDEFSIGLQAFNEAIDCFDETKNVSFLYFAGLVINRRLIDYIRHTRRFKTEYPFTYFEAKDNENYLDRFNVLP
jgi:RNA polymerase sigma factor